MRLLQQYLLLSFASVAIRIFIWWWIQFSSGGESNMLKPKGHCRAGGKGPLEVWGPPRPTLPQAGLTPACPDPSQAARRADAPLRGAGGVHPPPLPSDERVGPVLQVRKPHSSLPPGQSHPSKSCGVRAGPSSTRRCRNMQRVLQQAAGTCQDCYLFNAEVSPRLPGHVGTSSEVMPLRQLHGGFVVSCKKMFTRHCGQ